MFQTAPSSQRCPQPRKLHFGPIIYAKGASTLNGKNLKQKTYERCSVSNDIYKMRDLLKKEIWNTSKDELTISLDIILPLNLTVIWCNIEIARGVDMHNFVSML